MYFPYGETEIAYLKAHDKKLGTAIDTIGPIERVTDRDLFSSVIHHIIGQQISSAAHATIWRRLQEAVGHPTAESLLALGRERLQALGMTFKKAEYILDFCQQVHSGAFDIDAVEAMTDEEAIEALSALKGIGVWTAEMILTFCLMRPDVVSYGDLAIQRGMRMLYHHRKIDREKFNRYRRRYSPYGTVASLYLWAIAGGALEGLRDPSPKKK